MKERFLAFMLAVTMAMTIALTAFGAEESFETRETETGVDAAEPESESESESESETAVEVPELEPSVEVDINPIYADVVTAEELLALAPDDGGAALFSEPDYAVSESVVISQLREAMEARLTTFTVYYVLPHELEEGWVSNWIAMAIEETGSPTQGDYIRYHYGGAVGSARGYISSGEYYYTITFTAAYYTSAEQEDIVTGAVNSLINSFGFTEAASEYDKIRTIYDWICDNVTYDYAHLYDDNYDLKYSAYAALINRTSVCQGYASLFYRLCREVGIDVRVINGIGNGGPHAWNIVPIEGAWYNVDPTWDAGQSRYSYFLRCNSKFANHERSSEFLTSEFNLRYPMAESDYNISSGDTWQIYYDANGGTGAPDTQTKYPGEALTLSNEQPTKVYKLTYNANGGSVSPASKEISAVFNGWNTSVSGSGTAYSAGSSYTANMGATLYAQWSEPTAGTLAVPSRPGYAFEGWYTAKTGGTELTSGSEINKSQTLYAHWRVEQPVYKDDVEAFVAQLYHVCLDREPDGGGLSLWTGRLKAKQESGVSAAYGFIFSNEFKNKNLCNKDYIEQLYKAFMGRSPDAAGKNLWMEELGRGKTREEVFNGFALSNEFAALCRKYGINQGEAIEVPKYGTVPTGSCSVCGEEDGVTGFVKRLYKVCLNRQADAAGLADWTSNLWNHTSSGRSVAYGFIFSAEFIGKNYNDTDYVEHLYEAFMGRSSDSGGKATWLKLLKEGWTREQVFDGFVGSKEFSDICSSYGIVRD